MFCPNCGTKNPDDGRFCRSCGADLGNVTAALTGNLPKPQILVDRKGKPISWESAIVKLFSGLAFIAVTIALSMSQTGRNWWFWLLIPAFTMLGAGIAQLIQLKKAEKQNVIFAPQDTKNSIAGGQNFQALPQPSATDLVEIKQLILSNQKIEAIKIYRESTGVGLKEANDAVEEIERRMPSENDYFTPPRGSIYDTGELQIQPSVTENTTRHLEINKDGETMTLPKNLEK